MNTSGRLFKQVDDIINSLQCSAVNYFQVLNESITSAKSFIIENTKAFYQNYKRTILNFGIISTLIPPLYFLFGQAALTAILTVNIVMYFAAPYIINYLIQSLEKQNREYLINDSNEETVEFLNKMVKTYSIESISLRVAPDLTPNVYAISSKSKALIVINDGLFKSFDTYLDNLLSKRYLNGSNIYQYDETERNFIIEILRKDWNEDKFDLRQFYKQIDDINNDFATLKDIYQSFCPSSNPHSYEPCQQKQKAVRSALKAEMIQGILAHEIGHIVHNDAFFNVQNRPYGIVHNLLIVFIFQFLKIEQSKILPLIGISYACSYIYNILKNLLSREKEYEADKFAHEQGYAPAIGLAFYRCMPKAGTDRFNFNNVYNKEESSSKTEEENKANQLQVGNPDDINSTHPTSGQRIYQTLIFSQDQVSKEQKSPAAQVI